MSGVSTRQKRKTGTVALVDNEKSTNKVRKTSEGKENDIQNSRESPFSTDDESEHSQNILCTKKKLCEKIQELERELAESKKKEEHLMKENNNDHRDRILSISTKSTSVSAISGNSGPIESSIDKHKRFVHSQLHNYIKRHWFTGMKFFEEKWGEKICHMSLNATKDAVLLPGDDIPREEFVLSWSSKLNRFFAKLRHGSKQAARRKYLCKFQ